MSRFIESIQLKDGQLKHLSLHLKRMERTIQAYYHKSILFDKKVIEKAAKDYSKGIFKCRIVYTQQIEEITITPYQIRLIKSLQLVDSQLDYTLKYEDRTTLNRLFQQRGHCDDVVIAKDGLITDGSYTNLAFFDGKNWFTPTTPLLKGIQREVLLTQGIIKERIIRKGDLLKFQKVKLFNAMMDWEVAPTVPIVAVNFLA